MPLLTSHQSTALGDAARTEALLELLQDPSAYAERPSQITMIETHISWVFLTDRYAYKLKKPVRFNFLDFSTLALRQQACLDELTLNRRLAPTVYLDLVRVTEQAGRLRLSEEGSTVDWLVRMRRLPEERSLARQIRSGTHTDQDVRDVAELLTSFYRELPPVSLRTDLYRRQIEEHVLDNRQTLLEGEYASDDQLVKRVHAAQLRVLRLMPEVFDGRVVDGRIVDGHGDLRPEHIFLTRPPAIIDCIEFNAELRQLDVLDELSFLAVECALLGDESPGGRILEHYCRSSADCPPQELLSFYMNYRACVRAKVHVLRSSQLNDQGRGDAINAANEYLRLAARYADEVGPPLLIVVRGLTGTGKSTLAGALAESLGLAVLSTDSIRRELFGASPQPAGYGGQNYRPRLRQQVYAELLRRARTLLRSRHSLVVDGTFLSTKSRALAASCARSQDAIPVLISCRCPQAVAEERIAARRGSQSESRPEFFGFQSQQEEADPPGMTAFSVDTTSSVPAILDQLMGHVRKVVEAQGR